MGMPTMSRGNRVILPIPKVITFDCYDTLVQFPIDDVTRQILGPRATNVPIADLLADFEMLRYQTTTHGPYRPYHEVERNPPAFRASTLDLPSCRLAVLPPRRLAVSVPYTLPVIGTTIGREGMKQPLPRLPAGPGRELTHGLHVI
jgi:hypothetical protein